MIRRRPELNEQARQLAVAHADDETSRVTTRWVRFDDAVRSGSQGDVTRTARDLAAALLEEASARAAMERDQVDSDADGLVRETIALLETARNLYEFSISDKRTKCPNSDK